MLRDLGDSGLPDLGPEAQPPRQEKLAGAVSQVKRKQHHRGHQHKQCKNSQEPLTVSGAFRGDQHDGSADDTHPGISGIGERNGDDTQRNGRGTEPAPDALLLDGHLQSDDEDHTENHGSDHRRVQLPQAAQTSVPFVSEHKEGKSRHRSHTANQRKTTTQPELQQPSMLHFGEGDHEGDDQERADHRRQHLAPHERRRPQGRQGQVTDNRHDQPEVPHMPGVRPAACCEDDGECEHVGKQACGAL